MRQPLEMLDSSEDTRGGTHRDEQLLSSNDKINKIIKLLYCNCSSKSSFFLQFFGGLVLGCIKTKFCKKICV